MESGLVGIVLGSVLLIGFGMIPGLALIRILDPGADRLRQMMLLPAASLLILHGLAGWLVVILEHIIGSTYPFDFSHQHTLSNLGLAT